MSDILFQAVIEGFEVKPKVRMTQRSKWSPRARVYLESQETLAGLLRTAYTGREPISEPCILSFSVHLTHRRRVDVDNIQKAIQDSLQYCPETDPRGPVIKDDHLIHGTDRTRMWKGAKKARVEVTLKKHTELSE